jgi:hypothetical protein
MLAAYYFNSLLKTALNKNSDLYLDDINDFINYIFDNVTIIKIVCHDESFAIKLFGVLNDRGLNLTPADIIKAHMMESMVGNDDELNKFVKIWDDIEKIVSATDDTMKWLLSLYFYYLNSGNPKKSLQDEFKPKIKESDPKILISDIKEFSKSHYNIINDDSDIYISMLKHLNHNIYWKSILVTAVHIKYEEYENLKKLITQYYYSSWISGGTAARIKQTSFNILKMVKDNIPINDYRIDKDGKSIPCKGIKSVVLNNLNRYKKYQYILENKSIDNESWIRPVLLMIEYSDKKINYINSMRNLYIDHIFPKKWNENSLNWKDSFSKDDANKYLSCLGNLTLISGKNNFDNRNVNYKDKENIYIKNNGKGLDGRISFDLTSSILSDYENWTVENIEFRTLYLIEKINSILSIKT